MSGQSHVAILLLLTLTLGLAVWARPGGLPSPRSASNIAWVCSSNFDSLGCFLASLSR